MEHNMAKKTEGWWLDMGDVKMFWEGDIPAPNKQDRRATLVEHEDKHERVFTES